MLRSQLTQKSKEQFFDNLLKNAMKYSKALLKS